MPFVLIPSRYDRIPEMLSAAVPEFGESDEYRLVEEMTDLPGVILGAFAKFVVKLISVSPASEALTASVVALDHLCASSDDRTQVALSEEFFPALADQPDATSALVVRMNPTTHAAYLRWEAEQG